MYLRLGRRVSAITWKCPIRPLKESAKLSDITNSNPSKYLSTYRLRFEIIIWGPHGRLATPSTSTTAASGNETRLSKI